ncbi:MAG: hypothetical protein JWO31_2484 [Phycisphaerales bacterium]|nr:hypothetical protein [Phycisphaerales bacterium]
MTESDRNTTTPNYRQPGVGHLGKQPTPSWQMWTAYVLIALPVIYANRGGDPYWATPTERMQFFALIAIAVGAGLFIVRRRPRNLVGWLGLVGWGGLCVLALTGALLE